MLFSPPFFLLILSFFSRFSSYVPATAELKYLYMARRLELYGIHPQEVTVSTDLSLSTLWSGGFLLWFCYSMIGWVYKRLDWVKPFGFSFIRADWSTERVDAWPVNNTGKVGYADGLERSLPWPTHSEDFVFLIFLSRLTVNLDVVDVCQCGGATCIDDSRHMCCELV